MRRIKIKNFGPIKAGFTENNGFFDVEKVTIFIGNQGTGKSSVAKLISTLTWLEKALYRGELTEKEVTNNHRFINNYCAYQGLKNYFQSNTEIEYQGDAYEFSYRGEKLTVLVNKISKQYLLPKIMYIPAERNFVSVVNQPDKLKGLPSPLLTFLAEYEKALEAIKENIQLPINNVEFEFDKLNKIANIRGEDYKIRLSEASSGFQSAVPLFLVSHFLTKSIGNDIDNSKSEVSLKDLRRIMEEVRKIVEDPNFLDEFKKTALEVVASKYRPARFINIVEEPEQNLYPKSQKEILFKLLEFANFNPENELLITTHSPYIISYLTLAIKSYNVQEKITQSNKQDDLNKKLAQIIPLPSVIHGRQVIIYELTENGSINKLPTFDGLPSDNNFLNQQLADSNELFDQLLEIEELCQ